MIKSLGNIRPVVHRSDGPFFSSKAPQQGQPTAILQGTALQPLFTGLKRSITARLPGFKIRFKKSIAPMSQATTVGEMKRYFQSLPQVVKLAQLKPRDAYSVLAGASQSPKALYVHLTSIACGNTNAMHSALHAIDNLKGNHSLVLDCIRRVAQFRPNEARELASRLFNNTTLSTSAKLAMFRELTMSKGLADKGIVIGGFEAMMRGSSSTERNNQIYPQLLGLLEKWKPHDHSLRLNHTLVGECLRGWISSCQVISNNNHARAQQVLHIPPSARG